MINVKSAPLTPQQHHSRVCDVSGCQVDVARYLAATVSTLSLRKTSKMYRYVRKKREG